MQYQCHHGGAVIGRLSRHFLSLKESWKGLDWNFYIHGAQI
jgi:hypothetical protein